MKPYKHSVDVAVKCCLKFAVYDLCIKIFKQIYFVWEQCLSNKREKKVVGSSVAHWQSVIGGFAACKRLHHKFVYVYFISRYNV